jgi:hypothetical protein
MSKWIIRIAAVILAVAALAGAGFAGYRIGFNQGAQFSGNPGDAPRIVERFHQGGGPEFSFRFQRTDRVLQRGFLPGGFHGRGVGFLSPLSFLVKVALLGLVAWAVYKLFAGSGWQLTFTRNPVESTPDQPSEPPAAKRPKSRQ